MAPMRGGTKTLFLTVSLFELVSAKTEKAKMAVPRASAKQAVASPIVLDGSVLQVGVLCLQHEYCTILLINFKTDYLLKILTERLGRSNTLRRSPNNSIERFILANLFRIQDEIGCRCHDRTHQLCYTVGQYLAPSKRR